MRSGFKAFTVLLLSAATAGCRPQDTKPVGQSGSPLGGRADRGASLLTAAAERLNDLPSFVDTVLRPPSVVLDSRKSSDGKDVLATCKSNPEVPDSLINLITVPAGNSRFKSLRIRPGDIVKLYVLADKADNEDAQMFSLGRQLPIDLTVAQVLSDNALLVQEGLNGQVEIPAKLEIWRFADDRADEIRERLTKYVRRRLPALGWEPSPDGQALTQIVEWLNQWSRQAKPSADFQVDPLLGSLGNALLKDEQLRQRLTAEALGATEFEPEEGRLLQEAIWLRDISRWAQGGKFDDLSRAEALFDWTVRNIQLEADTEAVPHRPWQALLYGRGTATERAWVFALLCRQQGLDAVVLTPATANNAIALPAVLAGGQLHMFDARLGLPIRGPDGKGVATLEQIRADDALLRRLDLPDMPFPLTAEQLQLVTANIVADEFDLSRAAFQLERKLTGENRVTLTSNASEVAGRVKSLPGVSDVRLWDVPFKTLRDQLNLLEPARLNEALAFEPFAWRPTMWQARVLHFQGKRGPAGDARTKSAEEAVDGHVEATRMYSSREDSSKAVRPSPRDPAWASPEKRRIAVALQMNAAYWVGLLLFDDGRYEVATQWFKRPELSRDSPWVAGAQYNLARTYEALGKRDEAIIYEADTSPQKHGNRLRAKFLKAEADVDALKK